MEKIYCSYHPTRPAMWRCEACDAAFCPDCVSRRDFGGIHGGTIYLCPRCGCAVEELPVQNMVEPFWSRLPGFFAYPFKPRVIVLMTTLSVFMTLFSAPGLLSALIQLLLFGVLLKYCFAVLSHTARGVMTPPEIDENTISKDFGIVAKYWLMCTLIFVAGVFSFVTFVGGTGHAAGIALFAACVIALLLVLPAQVMVLAASGSLLNALNPGVSVRMAFRIGPPYLLMYVFLSILYLAPGTLVYLVSPYIPAVASTFVFALANCYYSIVAHHLMGYVILQNHDTIGYEVDLREQDVCPAGGARGADAARDLLNAVNVLIKDGKYPEAVDLIRQETNGTIANIELAERYYHLLKLVQKTGDVLAHAPVLLDLLVKANRMDQARKVYLECTAADPGFSPRPALLFRVAASLSEVGNHRACLEAYNRFIRHSPEDPLTPKAYFLAAKVFNEKVLDPLRAARTLERLIGKFPEHELTPHARKYLDSLRRQN